MERSFNIGGECNPADHYMLPASARLAHVRDLVDRKGYFLLYAPRQSGKTTSLSAMARELTSEGRYAAMLVSMKVGAPFPDQVGDAESALLSEIRAEADSDFPPDLRPPPWPEAPAGNRIRIGLSSWAQACPRPLVLFLGEMDTLTDATLRSVLGQLHAGYRKRPRDFPWSLALVGLRDLPNYQDSASPSCRLRSGSPFDVISDSLTLLDFTRDEIRRLYAEHTSDTGQQFLPDAVDRAFYLTRGQPWLVNALARQVVERIVTDRTRTITAADVEAAKEALILKRTTHLDSLAKRLDEDRVRAVLEPIMAGDILSGVSEDDRQYAIDLGLVRRGSGGQLEIANPIYREVVPRSLSGAPQDTLPTIEPTWLRVDGSLDPERLLASFLLFWRQHGEPLMGSTPYHEIAPHLVLMAFLHRVVNGGGTIEREYAVGSGRLDLCVRYRETTLAMELKVWRGKEPDPVHDGLRQLDRYLEGLSLSTGWLVIFDRRPRAPRAAKRTKAGLRRTPTGRRVVVIRA